MGIRTRGVPTSTAALADPAQPVGRGENGRSPAPEARPAATASAECVSVIEVNTTAPVWRWDVPGLVEPMPAV